LGHGNVFPAERCGGTVAGCAGSAGKRCRCCVALKSLHPREYATRGRGISRECPRIRPKTATARAAHTPVGGGQFLLCPRQTPNALGGPRCLKERYFGW